MISKLLFEWCPSTEEFRTAEIGKERLGKTVEKIIEHKAKGEGDKWHYDIHYTDGSMERTFYPARVFYGDGGGCTDLPF